MGHQIFLDKMAFELFWDSTTPPAQKKKKKKKMKFIACFFGNLFAHLQSVGENGGGYICF